MRELAKAQARSGLYAGVGIGVITYRDWPKSCLDELSDSGLEAFRAFTPKIFGTGSFLWQRIQKPPIGHWLNDFSRRTRVKNIIVHFHNAWMSGVFLPLPQSDSINPAAVVTFHGVNKFLDRQFIRHRLHRWMAQRLVRYRATLTSVDRANTAVAEMILGLPAKRFQVVANGVPPTFLEACPHLRNSAHFTLGHIGSLIPQKGWDIACRAVIEVAREGVPCRLIIAGAGPDEPKVRELAQTHPNVIEFRGFVPNPRENLMPELDLLSLMSSHEGLPMSAVEALSVGLPVVGTAVGGMAEVVVDGKTGFLVERSVKALKEIIARLAVNRLQLRPLADASREHFREHFEISRIVENYHRIYLSALPVHAN